MFVIELPSVNAFRAKKKCEYRRQNLLNTPTNYGIGYDFRRGFAYDYYRTNFERLYLRLEFSLRNIDSVQIKKKRKRNAFDSRRHRGGVQSNRHGV